MARTRSSRSPARAFRRVRKNFRIDPVKLKHTQRILGTKTETETIHRALELVVTEAALAKAVDEFIRLGQGLEDMDASRF